MRARIDAFLNSWVSKKLMVFCVATGLALSGSIQGSEWVNIAIVYIGTQGAIDAIVRLRGGQQQL